MRKNLKKLLSVILAIVMVLSCFSATFGVMASAAEWTHIDGITYDPVTLYVQSNTMTAGKTYLIALGNSYTNRVIKGENNSVSTTQITLNNAGNTGYYTTNNGTDTTYNAINKYLADETNIGYADNEFLWNSSALYNDATGKYLQITVLMLFRCPPHPYHGHILITDCP